MVFLRITKANIYFFQPTTACGFGAWVFVMRQMKTQMRNRRQLVWSLSMGREESIEAFRISVDLMAEGHHRNSWEWVGGLMWVSISQSFLLSISFLKRNGQERHHRLYFQGPGFYSVTFHLSLLSVWFGLSDSKLTIPDCEAQLFCNILTFERK